MTTLEAPTKTEQLAERAARARKLAAAAQRKAQKIAADEALNRSTRTRNALKLKADTLDQVADVLAGKD